MEYCNSEYYQYEYKQNKLTQLKTDWSGGHTAYYNDVISTKKPKFIKVKIKITKKTGGIVIGIDEANHKWINKNFSMQKDTLNYSYASDGDLYIQGKYTKYGDKYGEGDIISMIINTKDMNIFWCKNNKKYKKVKIKPTKKKYNMAILIYDATNGIKILDYAVSDVPEKKKQEQCASCITLKSKLNEMNVKNSLNLEGEKTKNLSLITENEKLRNERDFIQSQNIKLKENYGKLIQQQKHINDRFRKLEQEKEEYKNANLRQQNTIRSYQSQIESLNTRNNKLSLRCNKLEKDNGKLLEEQKSMEIKIIDLQNINRELKSKLIYPSNFMEWQWKEILQWIMSLENGRFSKYSLSLEQNLKDEELTGVDLKDVDVTFIKGWGVTTFKDKRDLMKHIQKLIQENDRVSAIPANEGQNDAPTAYI